MKEVLYNHDNIIKEDITEAVIRVKMLLANSKSEILLGFCNKTYQWYFEDGETLIYLL